MLLLFKLSKTNFRRMKWVPRVFPLLVLFSSQALACKAAPAEQVPNPAQLVQQTAKIVLAKVERVEDIKAPSSKARQSVFPFPAPLRTVGARYYFKVIESLKGDLEKSTFEIEGSPTDPKKEQNFKNHTEARFWNQDGGRMTRGIDCQIRPTFSLGHQYLIFLQKPYYEKSFERIDDSKDKWLSKVRELIAP